VTTVCIVTGCFVIKDLQMYKHHLRLTEQNTRPKLKSMQCETTHDVDNPVRPNTYINRTTDFSALEKSNWAPAAAGFAV
jgi:hypothetical protein